MCIGILDYVTFVSWFPVRVVRRAIIFVIVVYFLKVILLVRSQVAPLNTMTMVVVPRVLVIELGNVKTFTMNCLFQITVIDWFNPFNFTFVFSFTLGSLALLREYSGFCAITTLTFCSTFIWFTITPATCFNCFPNIVVSISKSKNLRSKESYA